MLMLEKPVMLVITKNWNKISEYDDDVDDDDVAIVML